MSDIIQDARQFAAGIALGGEVENMAVAHIEALCGEVDTATELLLDAWQQWAMRNYGGKRLHHGFLSTAEDIEDYLRERGLLNEDGTPKEDDHE
jgi:hypothetical protein